MRLFEKDNMVAAPERSGSRISGDTGAAQLLGLRSSTLKSRMKALDVHRPGGR